MHLENRLHWFHIVCTQLPRQPRDSQGDQESASKPGVSGQVRVCFIVLLHFHFIIFITYNWIPIPCLAEHALDYKYSWYREIVKIPGGYSRKFLVGVCRPVLQFRPKKFHFPHPFSDLASMKLYHQLLSLEQQQKDLLKSISNSHISLSFLFILGWNDKYSTFMHSRSSLENHTRFQTKMGKLYTRFQTQKAKTKTFTGPLGWHIPTWLI